MRTIIYFLIAGLALASQSCSEAGASIGNTTTKSKALLVDYVVVQPEPVANVIHMTGTLVPSEMAQLSAQSAGMVQEISFREGQRVSKGQLLLKLDDRQWRAQQQKLEAQLATATKDLERKQALLAAEGISQVEVDEAALLVATIEADMEELKVRIDHATIRAPFSGQIGLRDVSRGAYLSAGDPVARLVQNDPLKLEFNVPERYAGQIRRGQRVQFTVAEADTPYEAQVYATEPVINESTRALRIRARVPNRAGELIAGAFAEISLTLDSIPNALLVPTEAVVPRLNEQIVYRIVRDSIQEVIVQPGVRLTRQIQIESGLSAGDTIVISGLLQAKDGLPVRAGQQITLETLQN